MGWLDDLDKYIEPSSIDEYIEWKTHIEYIKSQLEEKNVQILPIDSINKESELEKRKQYITTTIKKMVRELNLSTEEQKIYARRMLQNWDYDPTDPLLFYWDSRCHWLYATKGPDERDGMFRLIVRYWVDKDRILGYIDDDKNSQIIKSAREMADVGKFRYDDWILAQAVAFYPTCYLSKLKNKYAVKITTSWIRGGRYKPALFNI